MSTINSRKIHPRKQEIKEKAGRLFGERGFAAGSMRQLAQHVGIEPASLYNHYASKDAILNEICRDMSDRFLSAIRPIAALDIRPVLKLQKMMRAHLKVIFENRYAASVFFHEWRYLKESHLKEFKKNRKAYRELFKKVMLDGYDAGYFAFDDLRTTLSVLFTSMNWSFESESNTSESPEVIADRIFLIISKGILKKRKNLKL